jgi:hypothetical protein
VYCAHERKEKERGERGRGKKETEQVVVERKKRNTQFTRKIDGIIAV